MRPVARSPAEAGEHHGLAAGMLLVAVLLTGCATTTYPLMPAPMLYTGAGARPLFEISSVEQRQPGIDLFYMTDRVAANPQEQGAPYTSDRARSMAWGTTRIEFGDELGFDALARLSIATERTSNPELRLGPTRERGRFPPIPYAVVRTPEGLARSADAIAAHDLAASGLQEELARRLARAPRQEVVMYVHGYSSSFADAATTMGELCHFLGREFVCGLFSWPAGGTRGLLFGYNVDRESGEFAVEHLLKTIRIVAATPGLRRLHLIAHSRGTDVLSTALSALSAESYILKTTVGERFRLGNVLLLAPDMDADVAPSKIFRIVSDPDLPWGSERNPGAVVRPPPAFRVTVYVSPDDKALATSGWLFGSIARLGRIDAVALSPQQIESIRRLGLFDVIQVRGTTDFFGHGYFKSNPRVSADIIALLRYGLAPNDPGRPLEEIVRPFWRVPTPPPGADQ